MHIHWNNDRGGNFAVPIILAQLYSVYIECDYIRSSHSIPLPYFKNTKREIRKEMWHWKLWFKFRAFAFYKGFIVAMTWIHRYEDWRESTDWTIDKLFCWRIEIIFVPSIRFLWNIIIIVNSISGINFNYNIDLIFFKSSSYELVTGNIRHVSCLLSYPVRSTTLIYLKNCQNC